MPLLRRTDILWLRLACWQDPPFADGVPWRCAPTRFAELERRGMVEPAPHAFGLRAVATPKGRDFIATLKQRIAARNEVAHG